MRDFQLKKSASLHLSGDEFNSEEHAAIAWSMNYVHQSVNAGEEFISLIKRNSNGNYIFTYPETSSSHCTGVASAKVLSYNEAINVCAIIHSHPFYVRGAEEDQDFSDDDKKVANHYKKTMYVGNAMGEVLQYDPNKKIFKRKVITSQLSQYPLT